MSIASLPPCLLLLICLSSSLFPILLLPFLPSTQSCLPLSFLSFPLLHCFFFLIPSLLACFPFFFLTYFPVSCFYPSPRSVTSLLSLHCFYLHLTPSLFTPFSVSLPACLVTSPTPFLSTYSPHRNTRQGPLSPLTTLSTNPRLCGVCPPIRFYPTAHLHPHTASNSMSLLILYTVPLLSLPVPCTCQRLSIQRVKAKW